MKTLTELAWPDRRLLIVAATIVALCAALPAGAQTPEAADEKPQPAPTERQGDPKGADPQAQTQPSETPAGKSESSKVKSAPASKPDRAPAIKGYCPVAYFTEGKPVKGNPEIRSTYSGETYFLSRPEAKKQFDADPERYAPQFGALCTTALGGPYQNRLPSDPEVFDIQHGKLYLFSCERAKRAFVKKPRWFISGAKNAFSQPAIGGFSPVAYQTRNKAVKGHPAVATVYRGYTYWFPAESERDEFIAHPERYVPAYEGFCAEGVSRNKRYPSDPEQFVTQDGRTFLFYDAKAKVTWLVNPMEAARKADANWVTLKDKPPLP
jgi:YHS domain-containing protein